MIYKKIIARRSSSGTTTNIINSGIAMATPAQVHYNEFAKVLNGSSRLRSTIDLCMNRDDTPDESIPH